MLHNIIIGALGSVVAEIVVAVALVAKFKGLGPIVTALRSWFRLHAALSSVRMSRFTRSRDDYRLCEDAGTIDRYVALAERQLKIVSIHLITAIHISGLCDVFKKMVSREKPVEITISLLDPRAEGIMSAIAPALATPTQQLKEQIAGNLKQLFDLRENLPVQQQKYMHICLHRTLPFGSAILIDPHENTGKIQIETKCYKAPLQASWGFELMAGGAHPMYKTLIRAFEQLISEAETVTQELLAKMP